MRLLNSLLGRIGLKAKPSSNYPVDIDVPEIANSVYDQDGLRSIHNHDFKWQPDFSAAYERGVKATGMDYQWHWRVHVGLWAASIAAKLPGDFVECGVNKGFLSSSIMHYLDWNSRDKTFYLLDTFSGLDLRYVSEQELAEGAVEKNKSMIDTGMYTVDLEPVRRNFEEWNNVRIIQGQSLKLSLRLIQTRLPLPASI